ncbi:hypothetical protein ACVIN2_000941 [Bradyrhizobium sp. USDA 3650]
MRHAKAALSRGLRRFGYKPNLLSPAAGKKHLPGEGDHAERQVSVVAADVFCVTDGVEKQPATVLASIAMLSEDVAAKTKSPAA